MVGENEGEASRLSPLIDVYVNCLTVLQCNISIGDKPLHSSIERTPYDRSLNL